RLGFMFARTSSASAPGFGMDSSVFVSKNSIPRNDTCLFTIGPPHENPNPTPSALRTVIELDAPSCQAVISVGGKILTGFFRNNQRVAINSRKQASVFSGIVRQCRDFLQCSVFLPIFLTFRIGKNSLWHLIVPHSASVPCLVLRGCHRTDAYDAQRKHDNKAFHC